MKNYDVGSLVAQLGQRKRHPHLAPPVNESLLVGLARREFGGEAAALLYRLIDDYKSWSDAYRHIVAAESRRPRSD